MYLFETTDPLNRRVRMKDETLGVHIIADRGRTEFTNHLDVIKTTIEQPHIIVPSGKDPLSDVYFRYGAHPNYPNKFVKVPVRFNSEGVGTVSTAFVTDSLTQGTDSTGGYRYVNYHRS